MPGDGEIGRDMIGCTVLDAAGGLLGLLTSIYADADTGHAAFGGVTLMRFGRRRTLFAPLDSAVVRNRTITVRCGGQLARRAPTVPSGRGLPAEDEQRLYEHYDVPYRPSYSSYRRLLPAVE